MRPCVGKGGAPLRGERCAFHARERITKGIALATRLVVRTRSPACLAMTFAFSQRVALRAGEGGCCVGLPPHGAPPSNPRRQPRWAFRAATARMVRSALGKSRPNHICSQRPLRRDALRATPRAPQGIAEPRGLRGKSFGPPERCAAEGTAAGGSILELLPYIKGWCASRPLCAWREGRPCGPLLTKRTQHAPPEETGWAG